MICLLDAGLEEQENLESIRQKRIFFFQTDPSDDPQTDPRIDL